MLVVDTRNGMGLGPSPRRDKIIALNQALFGAILTTFSDYCDGSTADALDSPSRYCSKIETTHNTEPHSGSPCIGPLQI